MGLVVGEWWPPFLWLGDAHGPEPWAGFCDLTVWVGIWGKKTLEHLCVSGLFAALAAVTKLGGNPTERSAWPKTELYRRSEKSLQGVSHYQNCLLLKPESD